MVIFYLKKSIVKNIIPNLLLELSIITAAFKLGILDKHLIPD